MGEGSVQCLLFRVQQGTALSVCSIDHGSCTGTKVYSLKSGLEAEYNVFYFGYSKEQQSAAMERQLATRLKAG